MKVLVVGATGLTGSIAVRLLLARGDQVTALLGDAAPEVCNRELVNAGVGVRSLVTERPSLEDLFVALTGEGFDVAR